jgi:hypothetical protein
MRAKLKEIKEEMRRRRHQPVSKQGKWLRQVVAGFFAPWVFDGEACKRPSMKNAGLGKKVICQLFDPMPGDSILNITRCRPTVEHSTAPCHRPLAAFAPATRQEGLGPCFDAAGASR